MYGPTGSKAYTVSVLDILIEAGMADKSEINSSLEVYKQQMWDFTHQRKRNARKYKTDRYRPDSANDRDIRGFGYQKSADIFRVGYAVPTANRFEALNY